MHVGYILTGMLLCAVVQLSNWEALSLKIREQMKDDLDDDSDESSTSSSTSSSLEVVLDPEKEEKKKDRWIRSIWHAIKEAVDELRFAQI